MCVYDNEGTRSVAQKKMIYQAVDTHNTVPVSWIEIGIY